MVPDIAFLSQSARRAVQAGDWQAVRGFARSIQQLNRNDPEGYFLAGLVAKAANKSKPAIKAFTRALKLDSKRYDAAIELAEQYRTQHRYRESCQLLDSYQSQLTNSPLYLDRAAAIYTALGLHQQAWPLLKRATQLQPEIDGFRARLAACGVLLGKVEQAHSLYSDLLIKYPQHQRNHYEFARLQTASDDQHLKQMLAILKNGNLPAPRNIFLYYAIGKELEDLGRWQEAFKYFKLAGDTVTDMAHYDVADDIEVIDKVIEVCNSNWLQSDTKSQVGPESPASPIFIVGLPRTGTTLTERIISSHSQVETADETFYLQKAIRLAGGADAEGEMSADLIAVAARKNIRQVAQKYQQMIAYKLSGKPLFIDKYPYNYLYLGFIAKAFPKARLVYLKRHPMDSCFALYKQSFFKFAYSLENLGRYYVAHERLRAHWQAVLNGRLITVEYEKLVTDQENQTRALLAKLGLDFEAVCLNFEKNMAASATASNVQIREKIHTRSVGKWRYFEQELRPLQEYLQQAGIDID